MLWKYARQGTSNKKQSRFPPRRMKNMWKFSSACRHKIWWKTYYHLQPNEHRKNCFLLTLGECEEFKSCALAWGWRIWYDNDVNMRQNVQWLFSTLWIYIFKLERDEFRRSIDSSWIWVWATSSNAAFSKRLTKTIARIFGIIMMWSDYMRMPTTQPQNPKLSDNLH